MALPAVPHPRDLTDEQWALIGPFLPKLARRKDRRGRPWRENRSVLNGIVWILRTGAPWAHLPDRYPSYQTCHRRFQYWVRSGLLRSVLEILAQVLHDEGYLDLQEAFIDGSFAPAKHGGAAVGKTKRGKGSKIMAIADRHGRPVSVHVESATPHEVTLVHATLAERFVCELPVSHRRQRLRIGQIGCRIGAGWRGTDCASPQDADTADARRSPAAAIPTAVESRATLCLAAKLSADRRAL
jgi:transposase